MTKISGFDVEMIRSGSRFICNPPPTDTDEDWVILIASQYFDEFSQALLGDGFIVEGDYAPEPAQIDECVSNYGVFNSFRKGDLNYIVCTDREFYDNFDRATVLSKKLNLLNKDDRITVFQVFLYDNWDFASEYDID